MAKLRVRAESEFPSDLLLLLHPDIFLPETFETQLLRAVGELNKVDPDWALAGFFGVPLDWNPEPLGFPWRRPRVIGRGKDFYARYRMGSSNISAAQCIDETALLLRTSQGAFGGAGVSPPFDAELPSAARIWLGGTDTVLEGLARGRKSYVLGVDVLHQVWEWNKEARRDVLEQRKWRSIRKFASVESTLMHAAAMSYMSEKLLRSKKLHRIRVYAQNCDFGASSWRQEPVNLEGPVPFDPVHLKRVLRERGVL